ncbi:gliding motility-associated C-terminal domain-containing protein [Flagellimonas hymeniacidonis]|uniref:Gliding motility-associated C-terminal domain-containing protein n=1 Tax=Flagellimonas hymeniacidonis TaxID=2603628 RepID=A0A5C8V426_9FLAO|nr:gliding motility-associated C-terminal domain-containing protein [Flagellimonas hymeniacidonis]TXN36814.1 gliding motility-associated C-terminal domain-containing protein [Flagellimonas hymeniacidonis]
MKKLLYISLFLFTGFIQAQTALYNSGNIRIHPNGNLGFHTNLVNDTAFDQNEGLAGFYGNQVIQVSGSISPTFRDVEFLVSNNVFLQNSVSVDNNVNFVDGNILTPLNDQTIHLNFQNNGFFTGESDASKVTGFAAITNRSFFSFPVGDQNQLRPLLLDSESESPLAICAYFFENPSSPSSILESFDIEEKVRDIGTVTDREFWIIQSDVPATVTISWNSRSALGLIPNTTADAIIVVGWSKQANQWVIIGNSAQSGDISQGFVTSQTFIPSDFEAITFGTIPLPTDTFAVNNPTLGNYFLSPNGDGTNDFLVIEGMSESPNNSLRLFNRFGQKVFEKINYVDEFTGISNTGSLLLSQDIGLPEGIYYYLVTLDDLELTYQGFLFLDR